MRRTDSTRSTNSTTDFCRTSSTPAPRTSVRSVWVCRFSPLSTVSSPMLIQPATAALRCQMVCNRKPRGWPRRRKLLQLPFWSAIHHILVPMGRCDLDHSAGSMLSAGELTRQAQPHQAIAVAFAEPMPPPSAALLGISAKAKAAVAGRGGVPTLGARSCQRSINADWIRDAIFDGWCGVKSR